MKRLILAVASLALFACNAPSPDKLGIVTPPERTVNYDPSTVDGGLAAQVGFQVYSPLGDKSWQKFGTGNSQWQPQPTPLANVIQMWMSPPIDFLTPGVYPVGPPLQAPGIHATNIRLGMSVMVTARTGTVTGSPTFKVGNNGTHDNVCPAAAPTAANLNIVPPGPFTGIALTTPQAQLLDASNQYFLEVTVGATGTGLTTLTGRLMYIGVLTPIPSP